MDPEGLNTPGGGLKSKQKPSTLIELSGDIEWRTSTGLIAYPEALSFMEERVADILDGAAPEAVWLLEHPPLYTAGTSSNADDLLSPARFPVYKTGRGGEYTYHGPGQRVAYVMLDLTKRGNDIRAYVRNLEGWVVATLATFDITGERRDGRVGIWVVDEKTGVEKKIAAIGVRVRRWTTFHGIAINVSPELSHFDGIVPCGISDYGVTSLQDLGVTSSLGDLDQALKRTFKDFF